MKRPLIIILVLLALAGREACAQDIIHTKKGENILATAVIFGPSQISYRLYVDPTGPMQFIETSKVETIYFQNGEKMKLTEDGTEYALGTNNYYRLRDKYNPRDYQPQPGDAYNPALMGVASFLIPGLGQILEGEWGTGLIYMAGDAALLFATVSSLKNDYKVYDSGLGTGSQVVQATKTVTAGTIFCLAGAVALSAFSAYDAVRIAKVKNLHIRGFSVQYDF